VSRDPKEVADTFAAKAGKMQDASLYIYDAEALYTALRNALAQLADAQAQLANAMNALKWYADKRQYDRIEETEDHYAYCLAQSDNGKRAREVLATLDHAKEAK
jgi:hypothetical protein